MTFTTTHLGVLEYEEKDVLTFEEGLPGFQDEKRFIVIYSGDPGLPFHYLQSLSTPELAFVVTDPFLFVENYDFELADETVEKLGIPSSEVLSIFSVVTIPEAVEQATINLVAPVIINNANGKSKQVILNGDYAVQHRLFKEGDGAC